MIKLKKPIIRETAGIVHEAGKDRPVVVTLKPPNLVGFRAKGCQRIYWLTSDGCYLAAVKADLADKERLSQIGK